MGKPARDMPSLADAQLPEGNKAAADRIICQGMVPRALHHAAREEWSARGLTTGRFISWAMTEYLKQVNPKRLAEVIRAVQFK